MQYRIELSSTKKGVAQVHLPGRRLELEAAREQAPAWQVSVRDSSMPQSGIIELRAATAGDAVWRVARAAVRAVSELTGSPLDSDPGEAPASFTENEPRGDQAHRDQPHRDQPKRPS